MKIILLSKPSLMSLDISFFAINFALLKEGYVRKNS